MSSSPLVLESECEAEATLLDALAFIDAFSSDSPIEPAFAPPVKRKKRNSRPHRERVRSEIERLRGDAEALETTLARMKQQSAERENKAVTAVINGSPSTAAQFDGHRLQAHGTDRWMEIVVEEYRRRRQTEDTNRLLKKLLHRQTIAIHASQAALALQFTKEDLLVLYGSQQRMAQFDDNTSESSCRARVHQLYLNLDQMLASTGLLTAQSLLARSQRNLDSCSGVYYESICCVPVPLALEPANQAFWKQIMKSEVRKNVFDERHSKTFGFQCEQQTYQFNSTNVMRSVVQADRVIYIWSALTTEPSKHWTFVEDCIIIVQKADVAGPSNAGSLIQHWYRLDLKEFGLPSALDPLKDRVMDSLSTRLQNQLVKFSHAMTQPPTVTSY